LPNIDGSKVFKQDHISDGDNSGALYTEDASTSNGHNTIQGQTAGTLKFDASRSNSIYGSSDTVMVDSFNLPVALYLGL